MRPESESTSHCNAAGSNLLGVTRDGSHGYDLAADAALSRRLRGLVEGCKSSASSATLRRQNLRLELRCSGLASLEDKTANSHLCVVWDAVAVPVGLPPQTTRQPIDALTGLPNRAALRERLRRVVGRAAPDRPACTLLLIDLDHFAAANECRLARVRRQTLQGLGKGCADSIWTRS